MGINIISITSEGATEGEEYPDTSMETDAAPIVAESKLSAEAAPFVPESKDDIPAEDKEAGEVVGTVTVSPKWHNLVIV